MIKVIFTCMDGKTSNKVSYFEDSVDLRVTMCALANKFPNSHYTYLGKNSCDAEYILLSYMFRPLWSISIWYDYYPGKNPA